MVVSVVAWGAWLLGVALLLSLLFKPDHFFGQAVVPPLAGASVGAGELDSFPINSNGYSTQIVSQLKSLVNSKRCRSQNVYKTQPHLVFLKCSSLLDSIVSKQHSLVHSIRE